MGDGVCNRLRGSYGRPIAAQTREQAGCSFLVGECESWAPHTETNSPVMVGREQRAGWSGGWVRRCPRLAVVQLPWPAACSGTVRNGSF